jgi:ABC-type nitrate/sulfonate/bicarbonate transport system permease component
MNRALRLRLAGGATVLLAWQLLGMAGALGPSVAPPLDVLAGMRDDGVSFYAIHVPVTLASAGTGFLWGNLAAIASAGLVIVVPWLERLVLQIGIASACVPLVALAPILAACFRGSATASVMAGVSVYFTTLVGSVGGLRQADRTALDVVRAYGGGRLARFRKVQVFAALPGILTALKVAVPAALLGTVIGEFMGQETGLGAALVAAQTASDTVRTWGITLVTALVAGLAFVAVGAIGNLATPWRNQDDGADEGGRE